MSTRRLRNRVRAWSPVGLLLLWFAATAGFRTLAAPDEGRYVGVALAMLRSGDWLVPRLDGLPFFHKPPLFYWLGAASMSVFGVSEWAARLPSVLGATLAAASVFMFLRRWVPGTATARNTAVVLATMPFFYVGAQFANLDMLVAGCISATVLLAVHAVRAHEAAQPFRAALAGAFGMAALGVLAKGLIGPLLPGLVFCLWCASTRRLGTLRLLAWWPGWLLFCAIALPWPVLMQMRYPGFFDYFVVTQHFRRFAQAGFNNVHPFWFYVPVIAGLTLPWFMLLATAGWRARRARWKPNDVDWLMLIWLATILVFFSIPRSKLIGYVLPSLPPLAYFVARASGQGSALATRFPSVFRWGVGVSAALCVGSIAAVGHVTVAPASRMIFPADLRIGPSDRVLMLDAYRYDIPFYWQLSQPIGVVADWTPTTAQARDNWRKELFDAGTFDAPRRQQALVSPQDLHGLLCAAGTSWVIGAPEDPKTTAWLSTQAPVVVEGPIAVWRFTADSAGCADAPAHPAASAQP
ncbi:glycosyltransferase family 39 protein [soil metagenome]